MEDLSEENIRKNCPHCDSSSQAFEYPLLETENFRIVCDANSIVEGHILIIPKDHLSCIGEYPKSTFNEFLNIYKKLSDFLLKEYGSVSSFEHGKFGQTVFHSHIHFLPFKGDSLDIIPEGKESVSEISDLSQLKKIYKKDGGYLFFSLANRLFVVDPKLKASRFFRDRFAKALGKPDRGNWKEIRQNQKAMNESRIMNKATQRRWKKYDIDNCVDYSNN